MKIIKTAMLIYCLVVMTPGFAIKKFNDNFFTREYDYSIVKISFIPFLFGITIYFMKGNKNKKRSSGIAVVPTFTLSPVIGCSIGKANKSSIQAQDLGEEDNIQYCANGLSGWDIGKGSLGEEQETCGPQFCGLTENTGTVCVSNKKLKEDLL